LVYRTSKLNLFRRIEINVTQYLRESIYGDICLLAYKL